MTQSKMKTKIYVVHYGNYFPREVDSQYRTLAEAEKRVKELGGGMWEISEEEV